MKIIGNILLCICLFGCIQEQSQAQERPPNFIIIFTDDQGYGDLGCFGGDHVKTPNIDKMAAEGMKLTSFYVAAPVCTPSRAALMTGCYPKRINMGKGSRHGVLLSGDNKGLNPDEITIAEILKTKDYATGIMGKWHLGDQPEFLPTRQGFDEFFGIPYSHDIHPFHTRQAHFNFPPLPLLDGEKVIEVDPDADYLTQRITERAVGFIKKHKGNPFFLYVPHPIPHRPIHMSPPFMENVPADILAKLKEENGTIDYATRDKIYDQSINEIDRSVGQILDALKEQGIDENTIVIFTSDNGPSIGGSAGPLRGKKGSTYEGGMREATVIRWPGKIPSGAETDQVLSTMDLLPTFAKLAGAKIPQDRVIDGKDVWSVLTGDKEKGAPREPFYYYNKNKLEAVRHGNWKYHKRGEQNLLYNLKEDIGETQNVFDQYPEVAERLIAYFKAFEKELGIGDSLSDQCRPAGYVEIAKPLKK